MEPHNAKFVDRKQDAPSCELVGLECWVACGPVGVDLVTYMSISTLFSVTLSSTKAAKETKSTRSKEMKKCCSEVGHGASEYVTLRKDACYALGGMR